MTTATDPAARPAATGIGAMDRSDFAVFESQARAAGYDEALVRQWAPDAVIAHHAHAFDADAVVTEGEMWLTCGDETRHLLPGDTFALPNGTPHAERYGPDGAIYWVARRNPG
ncbi:MAG TPA: cupin domain-containing protein [Variovorax sp.]|nr:cupin domain-containing protein [Variovorax sp.]